MVSGSGIKNKILEAMALRRAVVSTPLGAEGIEHVPGRDLLLGSTATELAEHILGLLDEPARARQIGDAARRLVEQRYSWQRVADQYSDLYSVLTAPSSTSGPQHHEH